MQVFYRYVHTCSTLSTYEHVYTWQIEVLLARGFPDLHK